MATYGLEVFDEIDNANQQPAVPLIAQTANIVIPALNNTDIMTDYEFFFVMKGTTNAYTTTINLSPLFPYNFVQNIKLPYQSNSVAALNMNGYLAWVIDVLRGQNAKYRAGELLGDQKASITTGYTPETQLQSSGSYSFATSTAETFGFKLHVPVSIWMDRFYDLMIDEKGNSRVGAVDDVYVSPLLMQSIGRNITPVLSLNPISGTTVDKSPVVETGTPTTKLAWTDNGSYVTIRRRGYRQPGATSPMPMSFNWAYNWTVDQVNLTTAKATYTFPLQGQILSVVVMMFDPTLLSARGDMITINNLASAILQYGSGIVKYNDTPQSLQDRMFAVSGVLLTKGVFFWDLYNRTRTNREVINTYNTAAVQLKIDLGTNVPGAGSYMLVATEWLTQVQ